MHNLVEDITEAELRDIVVALKECPFVKPYQLSVNIQSQTIIIKGVVDCFYHKAMAQEILMKFLRSNIKKNYIIKNEVQVKK